MTILQQINLYMPPEEVQEPNLSLGVIRKLSMIAILACFVLYGASYSFFLYKQKVIVKLEIEAEKVHEELMQKSKEFNTEVDEKQINTEVMALTHMKKKKVDALLLLRAQGINNGVLFSNFFTALSERHVMGTWYTMIDVENNGNYLVLDGLSIKPDMIPQILDGMQKEPIFDGRIFNQFAIKRVDEKTVSFHIETGAKGLAAEEGGR